MIVFADGVVGVGEVDLAGAEFVTLVHLVIDLSDQEHGRRRAERNIDLPAVPRQGEVIWVSRSIALKVKSVTWMLADATPWLFLCRSEGRCKAWSRTTGS